MAGANGRLDVYTKLILAAVSVIAVLAGGCISCGDDKLICLPECLYLYDGNGYPIDEARAVNL